MNGWSGTIARINLTTGAITKERTNLKDAALFIGARGLGVKILSDEIDATIDPLSPENKLIFAPGTLLRNVCSFGRPVSRGHQRPVDGGYRGIELRRSRGGRSCDTRVTTP